MAGADTDDPVAARSAALRHELPFDPRYGYDLAGLRAIEPPEEVAGFVDFWQGRYAAARAIDVAATAVDAEASVVETVRGSHRVIAVEFVSWGNRRIGAWLTTPADGPVRFGCVVTHGYGGRDAPEPWLLPEGAAAIWPCLRGLGTLSDGPDLPDTGATHVLADIGDRESYVHGGCVADVWCAATALLALVPGVPRPLGYLGGSFGGGIGALAAPWDDRIGAVALTVPSFGHHPLRLTMPCIGSGESVRLHAVEHPAVLGVLAYYDAAVAARHLRVPTHVGAALFDPAVPPPGQFAVYNALPGPKRLRVSTAGHFEHPDLPEELAALENEQRDWLAAALTGAPVWNRPPSVRNTP